jgi:hypothetical protein
MRHRSTNYPRVTRGGVCIGTTPSISSTLVHFGGGPAQELPPCLLDAIRKRHTQMQWESIPDFEQKRRDLMRSPTSKHSIKLLGL